MFGLDWPGAIFALFVFKQIEGGLHAGVIGDVGLLEIVEGAKDVVVPARGIGEHGEGFFDDFSGVIGFIEMVHEDEFDAALFDLGELFFSVGVVILIERLDAFEDGEGGVERGVGGAGAVALAVEAAIGHDLGEDEIDDGGEGFGGGLEVGGVVEEHAVDADIAVFDGFAGVDATIWTFVVGEDCFEDGGDLGERKDFKVAEVEESVVGGGPFGLVEICAPVSVGILVG